MKDEMNRLVIPEGTRQIQDFEYSEHREIISADFPRSLEKIGAHAFYNCRSLSEIRFATSGTDIGNGAFKNCSRLKQISIEKNTDDLKLLKAILVDINQETEVELLYPDGHAKVVFPYYIDNYEENTPARIVMHISEGAGTMYRECIYSGDLDFKAYDALFSKEINLDIYDSAVAIAVNRLKYPYRLLPEAGERYRDYLCSNVKKIADRYLAENRIKELSELLKLQVADKETLEEITETARESGHKEGLCVLIDYYSEHFAAEDKKKYIF